MEEATPIARCAGSDITILSISHFVGADNQSDCIKTGQNCKQREKLYRESFLAARAMQRSEVRDLFPVGTLAKMETERDRRLVSNRFWALRPFRIDRVAAQGNEMGRGLA